MTTKDRAERAEATVARLLDELEWPVIVVDDASTDDTADRLRRRFASRVQVIRLERNRGAAARNVAVRHAVTPIVAFCDDDSWWDPASLRRAGEIFGRHADVGLIAGAVVVEPDGACDPIVDEFTSSDLPIHAAGRTVLGFLACACVVRREAFLAVGGFHPLLHIGGEETLLALDLRSAGWQLVFAPDVAAHHQPEPSGRSDRAATLRRNRVLTAVMRRPPAVALGQLTSLVRDVRCDEDSRRALWGVAERLPRALAARRRVDPRLEDDLVRLGI